MKKEMQTQLQQQQQHQEQLQQEQLQQDQLLLQHPYMSLYEPVLLQSEVNYFSPPSSPSPSPLPLPLPLSLPLPLPSTSPSRQQQRPDETIAFPVADQLPPSSRLRSRSRSRINTTNTTAATTTTTTYRANNKKRQKVRGNNKKRRKVDHSENGIAENTIQSVVHKHEDDDDEDDDDDDDDDDASFSLDSSDDEAIIDRMKLATKKSNKRKSRPRSTRSTSTATATATATVRSVGDESNASSSVSGDTNASTRRINTDTFDTRWEKMYKRLLAYKKEHKNTKVPRHYKEDSKLGRWVNCQRVAYRSKSITKERKRVLNSIGFVWFGKEPGTSTATWKDMYQRLVAYKKEHKNTNVPQVYKEDPPLGGWISRQRIAYKSKKITKEKKRLLDKIGFVKAPRSDYATWEEMYQRLVAYKKEHKDTKVPQDYKEDPPFGGWTTRQRIAYRNKTLTEERKRLLDSIKFERGFSIKDKPTWEEMYQRLVAYKEEYNDTNVPSKYKEDPALGRWVSNQRKRCKKEVRLKLLNDIGFVWREY